MPALTEHLLVLAEVSVSRRPNLGELALFALALPRKLDKATRSKPKLGSEKAARERISAGASFSFSDFNKFAHLKTSVHSCFLSEVL
jgi:hypothetical protein